MGLTALFVDQEEAEADPRIKSTVGVIGSKGPITGSAFQLRFETGNVSGLSETVESRQSELQRPG